MESRGQEACSFCTQAPGCAQPGLGPSSHAQSRGGEGTGHPGTVCDPGTPGSQTLASWSQGQCCACHTSAAEPWRVWEGPQLPAQGMDSLGPPTPFRGRKVMDQKALVPGNPAFQRAERTAMKPR